MQKRLRRAVRDRLVRLLQDSTDPMVRSVEAQLHEATVELQRVRQENEAMGRAVEALHSRLEAGIVAVQDDLRGWERRQRRDLLTVTDVQAARTSADYFRTEMDRAAVHFSKKDTLDAAVGGAPRDGWYLEFGVYSGTTLGWIVQGAPADRVFGFDSFEGLPEHWRSGFGEGAFSVGELPEVAGAALVVGLFDQSLPGWLADHPGPVAFVHVDADLYSSTVTVLALLEPRLQEGTVILFDEYFNYPGWTEHEHRAWHEFVDRTGLSYEWLGLTADDEQVSVRITGVGGCRRDG